MTKKTTRRIALAVVGTLALALMVGAALIVGVLPSQHDDFGTFTQIRRHIIATAQQLQATERAINREFDDYQVPLDFPMGLLLGGHSMGLRFQSYESDRLETISLSQMEVDPGSGRHPDVAFMMRPRHQYRAPLLFANMIAPQPGFDGGLYMDFYAVDIAGINVDAFLANQRPRIDQALALVAPYQRRETRGKHTRYLDPYKSRYRLELLEPASTEPEARRAYFDASRRAIKLYLDAYLDALGRAEPDPTFAKKHELAITRFVEMLYREDSAITVGELIFPAKDLKRFFLQGFWRHRTGAKEHARF